MDPVPVTFVAEATALLGWPAGDWNANEAGVRPLAPGADVLAAFRHLAARRLRTVRSGTADVAVQTVPRPQTARSTQALDPLRGDCH
jgi:hypothetical protein